MKKFVDVIVPLPIANQYTYSLPQEMVDYLKRPLHDSQRKDILLRLVEFADNPQYAEHRNTEYKKYYQK